MRILLVDDSQESLHIIGSLLRSRGDEVATASNGVEALQEARRSPPDCIVSDILMPLMDGLALCRECRADDRLRGVPFVLMTGTFDGAEGSGFAADAGADGFLMKTQDPDAFLRVLDRVVERPHISQAEREVAASAAEAAVMRQYNEAVIRKVFDKSAELEAVNLLLQESETKYRLLSDLCLEGVTIHRDGVIQSVNRAFCDILGHESEELLGADLAATLRSGDSPGDVAEGLLAPGIGTISIDARRKDGAPCSLEVQTRQLAISDEDVGVTTVRDVTENVRMKRERNALEARLQQARKMEAIGVLAGGVAHDLNNVLGSIVLLPDAIEIDLEALAPGESGQKQEISDSLRAIKESARAAADIVRDLVALSRSGRYDLSVVDVNRLPSIADESPGIDDLRESRPDVRIEQHVAEGELAVRGAAQHLERAVYNLVRNAVESIHGSGVVIVASWRVTLDEPHHGYAVVPPGDYTVIKVSDTGAGIEEEHLYRVFEPFFSSGKSSARSGSGLGLSVVQGVIRDHDGYVDVTSEVGAGTTFSLYLPLVDAPVARARPSRKKPAPHGTERILFVGSNPVQRLLGRKSLSRLGYSVADAEDGRGAVEVFARSRARGQPSPFELVLLDMMAEDGFDGLDTLEGIRALYPEQKVILVGTNMERGRLSAADELGAGFLSKPYDIGEIGRAVRRHLDSRDRTETADEDNA